MPKSSSAPKLLSLAKGRQILLDEIARVKTEDRARYVLVTAMSEFQRDVLAACYSVEREEQLRSNIARQSGDIEDAARLRDIERCANSGSIGVDEVVRVNSGYGRVAHGIQVLGQDA